MEQGYRRRRHREPRGLRHIVSAMSLGERLLWLGMIVLVILFMFFLLYILLLSWALH